MNVFIQDSSSTVGAGLSGLAYNTASLIAYYTFTGANATVTVITLATLAAVTSAWSSGGFKELDATHAKGLYRLDVPNAVLAAASGQTVTIYLSGAANMAPCVLEIELTAVNNQSTGFGLVNASANVVEWNGTAVATPATAGIPDVNTKNIAGTASAGTAGYTAPDWAHISAPTTTVDLSGTTIKNVDNAIATVTTVTNQLTAAAIATGVWQDATAGDFTASSSVGKSVMNGVALGTGLTINAYTGNTPQTGDAYARLGAPVGASVSADIAAVEANALAAKNSTAGLTFTVATKVDANMLDVGGQAATAAGSVAFPSTIASPTNITAGTITTATNLTNAPTVGDFTATMKTSIGTAVAASAVASVTGNVGGNVVGSCGSVTGAVGSVTGAVGSISGVTFPTNFSVMAINAAGRLSVLTGVTKDVALANFTFLMTDATTHAPKTGLTVAGTVKLDSGSFGSLTNAVSEVANGWYVVSLAAADVNGNVVSLRFTSSGADDTAISFTTSA